MEGAMKAKVDAGFSAEWKGIKKKLIGEWCGLDPCLLSCGFVFPETIFPTYIFLPMRENQVYEVNKY